MYHEGDYCEKEKHQDCREYPSIFLKELDSLASIRTFSYIIHIIREFSYLLMISVFRYK